VKQFIFAISIVGVSAVSLTGCGEPLPEKPRPTGSMANPAMAEQRIRDTMANPRFTQAQKDQIIATIKQRNHMQ
jgi:hypothetical protein